VENFIYYLLIGFVAQLVDGALGMAFGVICTTLLLSLGFSPLAASTTTHAAEFFTTGFSALSHHQFGNVNKKIFVRLLVPGMIGGIIGALILVTLEGNLVKLFMAGYLMTMGIIIMTKFFREFPPITVARHLIPLGFFGGLLDAVGGGGWGPVVTSTLLARGNDARTTIGSVNACEFFIVIATVSTFFLSGSYVGWNVVVGLAIGGALAAPLGAYLCKHVSHKIFLLIVGILIILLSLRTLWIIVYN
jgi:uncharacterized membrane protein YfcA